MSVAQWERSATGLWVPSGAPVHSGFDPKPVAVGLFCGAGGFDLGMIQAGYHVAGASDNDPWCALTYLCNLARPGVKIHCLTPDDERAFTKVIVKQKRLNGRTFHVMPAVAGDGWIKGEPEDVVGCEHFWLGDVRLLTGERILSDLGRRRGDVDCVFGGPPCQGFSTAGRREVVDPRNSLVFQFVRLVLELNPRTMVMENVPEMVSMVTPDGLPVVDALSRVLEDGGWAGYEAVRRSLAATSGTGAALRGGASVKELRRKAKAADGEQADATADSNAQGELFEATA